MGEEILEDLVDAGLAAPGAQLVPLTGGVSCEVWRIAPDQTMADLRERSPHGIVVKAPLATLRTPEVWQADISRGFAEAEALRWYAARTPASVPAVLWTHPEAPVLVVESAPLTWAEWREQLLGSPVDSELVGADRLAAIGEALGTALATWHRESTDVEALPQVLRTGDRLRTLRADPFHRATAREVPQIAAVLEELADELEATRTCLVHGDFSPKNALIGPPQEFGVWMLDAEVAHVGDPVLDVAYLSTHLICKAVARPELAGPLNGARLAFESAYGGGAITEDRWSRHTGAILAARVRGISRVAYLSDDQQQRILEIACGLLLDDLLVDEVWARLH